MRFRDIEVPDELVQAAREGSLVLFVGAGASRDQPSGLPDFRQLIGDVGTRSNSVPQDADLERPDVFLGGLADRGIDVHALVWRAISKPGSEPNRLHRAILDLAHVHPSVRVVTTNYDLHLEGVARDLGMDFEIFRAPALPVGDDFTGIVHLHGALDQDPRRLVVTDSDFGHAYLREAWAARFLERMFSAFTVAFIGYSHGDIVMQYLARSLVREGRRFVLTSESEADSPEWARLGLTPIAYPVEDTSHLALSEGLERWAELTAWGRLDHRRRIADLVEDGPPSIPEEVSYLETVLRDPERVRYFTEHARGPEWLRWASARPEFDLLFEPSKPGENESDLVARPLTIWVIDHYAMVEKESSAALRLLRDRPWTMGTLDTLTHRLFAQQQRVADWQIPWLVLVLHRTSAPRNDLLDMMLHQESWQERPDLAMMLLEHRTRPTPRSGFDFGESDETPRFEVAFAGDEHWLTKAWKDVFKPILKNHAADLLGLVIRQIRAAYQLAGALAPGFDPMSFGRSAIEPHPQDDIRSAGDMLIDAARDCLEQLLIDSPAMAAAAIDEYVGTEQTILRRLAVHGCRQRPDRDSDAKLEWLCQQRLLYDLDLQHEVFAVLEENLAHASSTRIEMVLAEADAGPPPMVGRSESPYTRYNLLAWMSRVAPTSNPIREAFERVQAAHPEFAPREHPDLNMYMTSGFVQDAEPFTVDALHSMIQADPVASYASLRSFADVDEFTMSGPTWTGALKALQGCVAQHPRDGLRIADVLQPDDSDARQALIRAWGSAKMKASDIDPDPGGVLASRTPAKTNGLARAILEAIRSWNTDDVRSAVANMFARGGTAEHPTAWHELPEARALAAAMWPEDDVTGNISGDEDPYFAAINHPAGDLAQFWINTVAYDWRQKGDDWEGLSESTAAELQRMMVNNGRNGLLARCVLSSRLRFLFSADHDWARSWLLPLFEWDKRDSREVSAIWRTFLQFGQYDDQILQEGLLDALLATMRRTDEMREEDMKRLGRQLAAIALKSSLDPTSWLASVTTDATDALQLSWMHSVGQQLRDMDPHDAETQWTRWIERYWSDRVDSLPRPFSWEEASAIAIWVLGLPSVRLAAVELVVRTKAGLEKDDRILMHLAEDHRDREDLGRDAAIWTRYLTHLLRGTSDTPWGLDHYLPEIVQALRPTVGDEPLGGLVDEAMRLGCTDAPNW